MRLRSTVLGLAIALGAGLTSSARAGDLDKYLPEKTGFYVHVNVNQLLAADVVRKAIPMAFDKFGDQIVPLIGLAKQLNPGTPDVPEEDVKKAINELKKPETIAMGFDAAKDVVPEIIVAGEPDGEDKFVVLIKCPPAVTPETVEAITQLAATQPQVKLKRHKVGKSTVYEIQLPPPQQDKSVFAAVPEPGVICFGMSKAVIEQAVAGKGGLGATIKPLAAKRTPKDFLFVAVAGGKDGEVGHGNLVLDKDISGGLNITYADAAKAKEQAEEMNNSLKSFADSIASMLGDKAKDVKPVLEKMKASATGKTVNGQFAIPGAVVEKLLAKE
jgi:hypothetical protein